MVWIFGLFGIFFIGVPIAFSLGFVTLVGLSGAGLPMEVIVQRMFTGVDNFALIAIPLFILAGNLMAVGGISRRITSFSESLVGHWPGGLGMVTIVASMIFAAVTGSAIAATAAATAAATVRRAKAKNTSLSSRSKRSMAVHRTSSVTGYHLTTLLRCSPMRNLPSAGRVKETCLSASLTCSAQ